MTLDCSHYRRPPPLPLGRGKVSRHSFRSRNGMDNRSKRPFLLRTYPRAPRSSRAHYRRLLKSRSLKRLSSPKKPKPFGDNRVQIDQDRMCFLFTMLDNPPKLPERSSQRNFISFKDDWAWRSNHLVEPDGIEPTTSCLQSMRSPK